MLIQNAILLLACTTAPATIDRVGPNAVPKSVLEGEWYHRATVADVPYGSAATFVGAEGDLERLRWSIEEDWLMGYRSYPNVDDADDAEGPYYGAPVAVYGIEKHFDIRRSYNPATGEETNVVEENTEADWQDRAYVRVDWSTNHAEVGFTLAGVELSVLSFYDEDPGGEHAPVFEDSDGDGVIDAFHFRQQVLAEPDTQVIAGYGDVPTCYFYGSQQYECDATEVSIAQSFVKVDAEREYVGQAYDDRWMETFGVFETMRLDYDRRYGLTETGRVWFANRHNLWSTWLARDDSGAPLCVLGDVESPCSSFSVDDGAEPVELPYSDRQVRQIVYHLSPDFPEDLRDAAQVLAEQWNAPFRDTVNELRRWECLAHADGLADCPLDEDLQVFLLCPNNPSEPGDPEVCSTDHGGSATHGPDGEPDLAEIGDLRYSFLYYVDEPQISSPYGYGPSAADPYGPTLALADGELGLGAGEIISANAYVYGHVLDRVATTTADLVELINGGISTEDFIDGENVQSWVEAVTEGGSAGGASMVGSDPLPEVWDEEAVAAIVERMDTTWAANLDVGRPDGVTDAVAWLDWVEGELIDRGVVGRTEGAFDAMAASEFGELFWSEETVGSYGFDPSADVDLDGLSPLDLVRPQSLLGVEEGLVVAGQHAVDLLPEGYTDPSLVGLALQYAEANTPYEDIWTEVRTASFGDVALHELGHNFGLRHNFSGSFDAFNFHPGYWELRDDGDMGPRHVDPETDAELEGGIRGYQYSTVMDYLGARNGAWHGLGHYDAAAVKFLYGQLVEVLTGVSTEDFGGSDAATLVSYLSFYDSYSTYPGVVLFYSDGSLDGVHYTEWPGLVGDLEARANVPLSRMRSSWYGTDGEDSAFNEGLTVRRGYDGLASKGNPAVPYRFCSDEFASGMACDRRDEGADFYEIQQTLMTRYWNGYLLNNFRRDRYGFDTSGSHLDYVYNRYFDPLRTFAVYYALLHAAYDAETDDAAAAFFAADEGFGSWTAAEAEALQFLVQVLLRPEPGAFSLAEDPAGDTYYTPVYGDGELEIELVTGAWYSSEWDFDAGYHWFDKQTIIGSYWEKLMALEVLTNTEPYSVIGVDTAVDPRAYGLGFQDLWEAPLHRLLGELVAGDVTSYAPTVEDGELVWRDFGDVGTSWPPEGQAQVEPAAYWSVKTAAGLYGKALLQRGYDNDFLNRSRIWIDGTGDAPAPSEETEEVRFTDPESGLTWVAWRYDEDGVELGSAARMLDRANALSVRCEGQGAVEWADAEAACAELESYSADIQLQAEIFDAWG